MRTADHRRDFAAAVYQELSSALFAWRGKTGRAEDTYIVTHMASLDTEGYAYED